MTSSRKTYTVFFFSNGNTAACKDGEQVQELQESWLRRYVKLLEDKGIDLTDVDFKMPNGDTAEIVRFKDGSGWNWRINL